MAKKISPEKFKELLLESITEKHYSGIAVISVDTSIEISKRIAEEYGKTLVTDKKMYTMVDLLFSVASVFDISAKEEERWKWSEVTFPESTAQSSLEKLKEEIKEIEKDIAEGKEDPMEYADALMCLFDSARRNNINVMQIFSAFDHKLKINKERTWIKNPDNSYSHKK